MVVTVVGYPVLLAANTRGVYDDCCLLLNT